MLWCTYVIKYIYLIQVEEGKYTLKTPLVDYNKALKAALKVNRMIGRYIYVPQFRQKVNINEFINYHVTKYTININEKTMCLVINDLPS